MNHLHINETKFFDMSFKVNLKQLDHQILIGNLKKHLKLGFSIWKDISISITIPAT